MSIAVIARFKAAYASFAKLLLVSSRGTSRAGRSSFSTGRSWASGKAAIQKELERRVAAKNQWKIIGKYVSGNVAVVQTELQIGYIEPSGVDRVVVWCIYETKADKIAVVTLVGQRTDPQTTRFIDWFRS